MKYPSLWIKIRQINPIFLARECRKCEMLVKRETLWKTSTNDGNNRRAGHSGNVYRYPEFYCFDCFPTKESLTEYLLKGRETTKYRFK